MWRLTTPVERTRRETRIQRVALVCKPHLSSAILHFPTFPNAPVWSFTISRFTLSPHRHYPPWIPTSCFIFCILGRWRRCHMWNRRWESSFENSGEGRKRRRTVSDTSSWQLGPQGGGKKTCAPAREWWSDADKICDTNTQSDDTFKETIEWWNYGWHWGGEKQRNGIWLCSDLESFLVPKDDGFLKKCIVFKPCCHKFQFTRGYVCLFLISIFIILSIITLSKVYSQ